MTSLKTLLNHAQPIPGFVYEQADFLEIGQAGRLDVVIRAHPQIHPKCSKCLRPCPRYDRLGGRSWLMVPLWQIRVRCHYAARRVSCPEHGVVVEHLPWSDGVQLTPLAVF